jgi:hypothetical protein
VSCLLVLTCGTLTSSVSHVTRVEVRSNECGVRGLSERVFPTPASFLHPPQTKITMSSLHNETCTQKESLLQEDCDEFDQALRQSKSKTVSQVITLVLSVCLSLVAGYLLGQIKDDGAVKSGLSSKSKPFHVCPTLLTLISATRNRRNRMGLQRNLYTTPYPSI